MHRRGGMPQGKGQYLTPPLSIFTFSVKNNVFAEMRFLLMCRCYMWANTHTHKSTHKNPHQKQNKNNPGVSANRKLFFMWSKWRLRGGVLPCLCDGSKHCCRVYIFQICCWNRFVAHSHRGAFTVVVQWMNSTRAIIFQVYFPISILCIFLSSFVGNKGILFPTSRARSADVKIHHSSFWQKQKVLGNYLTECDSLPSIPGHVDPWGLRATSSILRLGLFLRVAGFPSYNNTACQTHALSW